MTQPQNPNLNPLLARVEGNSGGADLIQIVEMGGSVIYRLNNFQAVWYAGTGAPTTIPGVFPGNLYIDISTGNIWELNSLFIWVLLPSGGGGGGVSSLNGLTGVLNILAGAGITVTPSGSGITIAATGGGGGVTSLNSLTGALDITAGSGIVVTPGGSSISIASAATPWTDIQTYGGVPKNVSIASETTTATASYGSPDVTLGAAKHFANGMGVCIWQGGPACTIAAPPGAPFSAVSSNVTGSGPAAAQQSINYQVVGFDAMGGLTAASASYQITTAPAIFGPVAQAVSSISQIGSTVTVIFAAPLNGSVVAGMTLHLTNVDKPTPNPANGIWTIASVVSTSEITFTLATSIGSPSVGSAQGRLSNSALINTISRSAAGVITVTTTQPHNYAVGAPVIIKGVAPTDLNGHFIIATTPTTSSFTCASPIQTAETGSGGYVTVWESIVVETLANPAGMPHFPANTVGYYVYSDSPSPGGALQLIGKTLMGESHFTDWGPFYGGGYVAPAYVPTTAPASQQNQMFTSTIASGGGTTNLVLANTITNLGGISGATIMYDDGPCLTAAIAVQGEGSVVLSQPNPPGLNYVYVFNSPLSIAAGTDIVFNAGCAINETITLGGYQNLHCPFGTSYFTQGGSFGQINYSLINGLGNPMIYGPHGAVSLSRLGFNSTAGNGLNAVMFTDIPAVNINQCSFNVAANGTSTPLIFNGDCANMVLNNCNFAGTSILGGVDSAAGQSNFCPPVPVLSFRSSDNPASGGIPPSGVIMSEFHTFNGRAVLIDGTYDTAGGCQSFRFEAGAFWNQGASQPFLTVTDSVMDIVLNGVINDTSFAAAVANWKSIQRLEMNNFVGAGGYPAITGSPIIALETDSPYVYQNVYSTRQISGLRTSIGGLNFPVTNSGVEFDQPVYINKNGALFVLPDPVVLTVIASGSGTWSAGTYTVQIFFQGWDGGIFVASLPTTVVVGASQQIVASWSQESGWQGAYISVNGQFKTRV